MSTNDIENLNNKLNYQGGGIIDAPGADDYSQWITSEADRQRHDTSRIIRRRILESMENAGAHTRNPDTRKIKIITNQLNQDLMQYDPGYSETAELYLEIRKAFPRDVVATMSQDELLNRMYEYEQSTESIWYPQQDPAPRQQDEVPPRRDETSQENSSGETRRIRRIH